MKATLRMEVDSSKPDMGVTDMIETHRGLFEMTGGREQIAQLMMTMLSGSGDGERIITRQMVEKWFNQKRRTIPSGVLLVALLTSCELIQNEINEINRKQRK